ncbi:hypothetical protein Q31a_01080 [Aureliella helgolandensis]|uniref:Uncharacterized protein n=1 Tax=Aureliella helgolandensis TaxID=2527968 RepID=A0A518FZP5_9BACT|nr:hypothetical protein Q31a_01080 [Aureliella helgolandensis]
MRTNPFSQRFDPQPPDKVGRKTPRTGELAAAKPANPPTAQKTVLLEPGSLYPLSCPR